MPKTQLPEYSSLVRWTVQDVINWLVQAGYNDCTRIFREAGVDGNKLVNLTDTELRRIKCPNKRIKDLVRLINDVGLPPQPPPSSNSGFMIRQPAVPMRDYGAPTQQMQQNDEDGSESDVGYDDDEFDDEFDSEDEGNDQSYEEPMEKAPVAPPRAGRNEKFSRPPITTPVHQHQVRPGPEPSGRRQRPPTPPVEDETYEDPDASAPPPVPALPTRRKVPSPEPVQELTYEDPDASAPPPVPAATHRRKLPSPEPVENCDEEYEEPDPEIQASVPPPGRRPPRMPAPDPPSEVRSSNKSQPRFQPSQGRRPPLPTPTEPEQEVYEDPDSQVQVQPTHGGPLPTPPGQKPPPVPSNKTMPPPRQKHGRLPDLPAPPKPEPEPEEELDVYEIPEEEQKPKLPGRRELPPTPQESQDDYLEMDDAALSPPPLNKAKAPAVSKGKPSASPRSNRRKIPDPEPQPVEEEFYEDPDPTPGKQAAPDPTPAPSARRNQETKEKKLPTGAVPLLPGMKSLNMKDEEPKWKTPGNKGKRELPPPPTAEEPAPEPVKAAVRHPVKPDYTKVTPSKTGAKSGQNKFTIENNEGDLDAYPWYHGSVSRAEADKRLKQNSLDGMYCIRKSSQGPDRPYVLVVFYKNKVYNLPVRLRSDHKYALGAEKTGEHAFPSLLEMVNFFKKNYLVIHASDTGQTTLVKSLPKS